ncbi:hypothetical protein HHK36_029622 [Tetracentron sinense]|uniref:3-beta hydroxysteroid dehydrogenase/isomerase domain-containing protein n=1 Tax=Tetracentron sinense TaxID=13715 RepID=A0A835D2S4_TETSI|nr:hypothetical protein HHK36_029622 [Tetracentron sinense]
MGIVRTDESLKAEIEESRRMLLECAGVHRRGKGKEEEETKFVRTVTGSEDEDKEARLVCVTSGISFLGLAIVNRLLDRGYSVRIIIDNEEDLEKLREMEIFGESMEIDEERRVWAVMAKLTDVESLCEAFNGCRGVFHTSAFVDPGGVSGYSVSLFARFKFMAEIEVTASENVMEACARTPSVAKCVFTSSLLACIWRDNTLNDLPPILDHNCWSDESLCRHKKMWFALGKTMAEKAAWTVARERDVKLATICPALVTGPEFCRRNPTASIAYLKGAQEMYADGLLATVDVSRVAEAHACVYEAMSNTASGRYVCFDCVIRREEEAEELAMQMGLPMNRISDNASSDSLIRFELCNRKLSRLMSTPSRCSDDVH